MTVTRQEIVEAIKEMTVLEVSEFVKDIEETFGITTALTVDIGQDDEVDVENAVEEQTEFSVMLRAVGDSRVKVIKIIRAVNELGLKEAKYVIDLLAENGEPYMIKETVSAEEAVELSEKLKAVGAAVEVF